MVVIARFRKLRYCSFGGKPHKIFNYKGIIIFIYTSLTFTHICSVFGHRMHECICANMYITSLCYTLHVTLMLHNLLHLNTSTRSKLVISDPKNIDNVSTMNSQYFLYTFYLTLGVVFTLLGVRAVIFLIRRWVLYLKM